MKKAEVAIGAEEANVAEEAKEIVICKKCIQYDRF